MSNLRLTTFAALAIAVASAIASTQAHAAQRTFVASFGADTNTAANCSLAAPCRGFAAAQTVTDNNGEIIVLDSAGYGAVTITKSIAIIAPTGVYAGIAVFPGANGVNIATAGVNVVLRGLNINGQGGNNGINMTAGSKLTVENCVISNLVGTGISVNTAATVRVTDTIVRDNSLYGIFLQNGAKGTITRALVSGNPNRGINVEGNTASTTTADIADSTIDGSGNGIVVLAANAAAVVKVSVRDSRVVRNSSIGLAVEAVSGVGAVSVSVSNNIFSNNGTGMAAFNPGAKLWASGNSVSDNASNGLLNFGALVTSVGNNAIYGNGTNTSGTITSAAPI